jgi:hypothetical protein
MKTIEWRMLRPTFHFKVAGNSRSAFGIIVENTAVRVGIQKAS